MKQKYLKSKIKLEMSNKLCPKIILEGTRLTFKTEIAFALNKHPEFVGPRKYQYHSPIVSGEWCAFTNYPWGRGLINFEEQEEKRAMETYRTWAKLFKQLYYYSWIVDRFHLSTQMYQSMVYNRQYDFKWLEDQLNECGFRLIFMTRNPESFITARKKRLKISGNPSQYENLDLFKREQEMMYRLVEESTLPSLQIDISNNNIEDAVEKILKWMIKTGGMYMEDGH